MIGFFLDNDFLLFHLWAGFTTAQYNHLHVITNTKDLLGRGSFYIIYTQGKIPRSHSSIRVLLTNTHKQKINKYWLERIHGKYLSCCIHVYIHWIQKLSCASPASLLHSCSTIKMVAFTAITYMAVHGLLSDFWHNQLKRQLKTEI